MTILVKVDNSRQKLTILVKSQQVGKFPSKVNSGLELKTRRAENLGVSAKGPVRVRCRFPQIVNGWCSSHQEILEAILTAARLARVEVKGASFCIAALRPFSISVFIDEVDLIAFSVKCKIDNSSGLLLESSTYVDVSGCLPWSKIEAEFRIS